MWIFLLSDTLSFVGLLLGYGILRAGSTVWRHPEEPALNLVLAGVLTLVLMLSSVTMMIAFSAAVDGNRKRTQTFLGVTIAGGVLFLIGQAKEYVSLIHEGLIFGHSAYASTFYAVTTFHGLHVFGGVVYLTFILVRSLRQGNSGDWREIELVDLFWHFVDLVWIFVFSFIYLIPATLS